MKKMINKIMNTLDNRDILVKEIDQDFKKIDLPIDTQIKIALNTFSSEQLDDIKEKYLLNEYHWNILGLSYKKIGNFEMAEKSYLNAIEIKPDYEEPYGNLMSLYIFLKRWDSLESIYQSGISNASSHSFIIFQAGRYQFYLGNYELSYNAALKVIQEDKLDNEQAFILGIKSLIKLTESTNKQDKKTLFVETSILLDKALNHFPNSIDLIQLKESIYLKEKI